MAKKKLECMYTSDYCTNTSGEGSFLGRFAHVHTLIQFTKTTMVVWSYIDIRYGA